MDFGLPRIGPFFQVKTAPQVVEASLLALTQPEPHPGSSPPFAFTRLAVPAALFAYRPASGPEPLILPFAIA
jgi:hypothetical protein